MPLTQLNNRKDVVIDLPVPNEFERVVSAKNALTGAQIYHHDLDPFYSPSFPVIIDGVPYVGMNVQILTTNVDISFIIAGATKSPRTDRATYFFTVHLDESGVWQVNDQVILSHDTDTDDGFYGLKMSEQLRLLGY